MQKTDGDGNVCIRCGRPRIAVKTWKEYSRAGLVIHTTTTCPNPDCQKIINQQFAAQKKKQETIEKAKQKRIMDRRQEAISGKQASSVKKEKR